MLLLFNVEIRQYILSMNTQKRDRLYCKQRINETFDNDIKYLLIFWYRLISKYFYLLLENKKQKTITGKVKW